MPEISHEIEGAVQIPHPGTAKVSNAWVGGGGMLKLQFDRYITPKRNTVVWENACLNVTYTSCYRARSYLFSALAKFC